MVVVKKVKKSQKIGYNGKKWPPNIFFSLEEGISIRNYLRNPIKMVPMLYNNDFRRKSVVFVMKKVKKQSYSRICSYFGGGAGGCGGGGGCDDGGSGLGGGGCIGGDSGGGGGEVVGGEGKIEGGEDIRGWWWNLRKVEAKSRLVKEF